MFADNGEILDALAVTLGADRGNKDPAPNVYSSELLQVYY